MSKWQRKLWYVCARVLLSDRCGATAATESEPIHKYMQIESMELSSVMCCSI